MPNWCYTSYEVNGSKSDIDLLFNFIDEACSGKWDKTAHSDFGVNWLGNLALELGIKKDDVVHNTTPCRGYFNDVDRITDNSLIFSTETAWTNCNKLFRKVIDHLAISVKVDYYSEEPGGGFFEASSISYIEGHDCAFSNMELPKDFDLSQHPEIGKLYNYYNGDGYTCEKEHLIKLLQKAAGTESTDVDQLLGDIEDRYGTDFSISIHDIDLRVAV